MQRNSAFSREVRHLLAEFPDISPLAVRSALKKSHGQLHQDVFALCANKFQKNGFFIDIGASDGQTLSNSLLLEKDFGWSGIAIEPDPKAARRFRKLRDCTLVESAVVSEREAGKALLVRAGMLSALSGHLPNDQHALRRAKHGRSISVATESLNEILEKNGSPNNIDFISLDIEGLELSVLESLDWGRYCVRAIAVEHNFTLSEPRIQSFLETMGFRRVLMELSDFDGWFIQT